MPVLGDAERTLASRLWFAAEWQKSQAEPITGTAAHGPKAAGQQPAPAAVYEVSVSL